jgi:ERF superfamily
MPDQPASLAAALAELQTQLPHIGKDETARVKSDKGSYSYSYADLATVSRELLPLLGKLGFSFTCAPTMENGQFVLRYCLRHAPSDHEISGAYPLPSSTPQTMGGAITYARRYCLLAVTGAAPDEDDDDAQAAEQDARAQRNAPPEVDEHGAATFAEQTRMVSGPEPGVERLGTTPVDDPWLDPAEPPEKQPRSSLKSQRQKIYIALGKRGIKDHKAAIERLLRRDITEPADMSFEEATSVLARVGSWDGRTEELLSPLAAQKGGIPA